MTETLLALVPAYGLPMIAISVFCSCIGIPVPGSLVLLAAGGFVAAGDLSVLAAWPVALIFAVAGDQAGFWIGRWLGPRLPARFRAQVEAAAAYARRSGGWAVYFSRWLVSPLGPWINLALGGGGGGWRRFTLFGVAGEITWVTLYLALGYSFADAIVALSEVLGDLSKFLAAAAIAGLLGYRLLSHHGART